MENGHAIWTYSMDKKHRDMDMEYEHEEYKCTTYEY
jgi:hypothetical protein